MILNSGERALVAVTTSALMYHCRGASLAIALQTLLAAQSDRQWHPRAITSCWAMTLRANDRVADNSRPTGVSPKAAPTPATLPRTVTRSTPLWPYSVTMAILLFVLDVALRRIDFSLWWSMRRRFSP